MTYLLDTHAFLWLATTPEMLPQRVCSIAVDQSSAILISVVVPWEISIKATIGKLDAKDLLDDFEAKVTNAGFKLLETTVRQVIRGGRLPLYHRDPFDRLLVAQAFELRAPILSKDAVLDLYGVQRIWN